MEKTISRMASSAHGSAKTVAELEEIATGIGRPVVERTTSYGTSLARREKWAVLFGAARSTPKRRCAPPRGRPIPASLPTGVHVRVTRRTRRHKQNRAPPRRTASRPAIAVTAEGRPVVLKQWTDAQGRDAAEMVQEPAEGLLSALEP
jgi:hypothetical protein